MTTVSTVGYGDITPTAAEERAYAIIAMAVGTGIFGYVIGSATNIMSASTSARDVELDERMGRLQEWLSEKDMPSTMQTHLRRHFRFLWAHELSPASRDREYLSQCPAAIRFEALRYIHRAALSQLPIFRKFDEMVWNADFQHALLQSLRYVRVPPVETLLSQGALVQDDAPTYLVIRGSLEVWYVPPNAEVGSAGERGAGEKSGGGEGVEEMPEETMVALLGPGDFVGEIASVSGELAPTGTATVSRTRISEAGARASRGSVSDPADEDAPRDRRSLTRTATVITKESCELFSFPGDAWRVILTRFPVVKAEVVAIAKERLAALDALRNATAPQGNRPPPTLSRSMTVASNPMVAAMFAGTARSLGAAHRLAESSRHRRRVAPQPGGLYTQPGWGSAANSSLNVGAGAGSNFTSTHGGAEPGFFDSGTGTGAASVFTERVAASVATTLAKTFEAQFAAQLTEVRREVASSVGELRQPLDEMRMEIDSLRRDVEALRIGSKDGP